MASEKTLDVRNVGRGLLAALMGVNVSTVLTWQQEGMPYKPGVGRGGNHYDFPVVIEWRIRRETKQGFDLELERAKLAAEQTRTAALKNDLAEGKSINLEAAAFVAQRAAFAIRQRIMTLALQEEDKRALLADIHALGETDFSKAEKEDASDATNPDATEEADAG